MTEATLAAGDTAPEFSLPTNGGGTADGARFRGAPLVLYFYPKADTPGCTKQACAFQEAMPGFPPGLAVLGVSKDPVRALDKFAAKYGLTFPLASDAESDVAERFGVWVEKSMYGKTYMGLDRATFLIDRDGRIARVWRKVKVPGHAAEVAAAAASL